MAKMGPLKEGLQFVTVYLFMMFVRFIPFRLALFLGKFFGAVYVMLDRRHRGIATENLRLALKGSRTDQQQRQIVRGSFQTLGQAFVEVLALSCGNPSVLVRRVTVEGFEHYLSARRENKGVLILTAHFGNWELIPQMFALRGFPLHVVARRLDNPSLDRLLLSLREWGGGHVLDKKIAASKIVPLLRQGETVGILLDQNTRKEEAVFVDYFGRPAATHKGLAILALRTGAPVVPVFIIRTRAGHRMVVEKPLSLVQTGQLSADLYQNTALFTQKIESYVREYPDHWLWVHRRWKTQPETCRDV